MITWDAKKECIFEMPTGGAAIMRKGPNLLKLARKEQCLALLTQLRTKFKNDGQFYRVFPNGEVQYLHPKDGVYPEKVNAGREGANQNMRSIGENANPVDVCSFLCFSCARAACALDGYAGAQGGAGAFEALFWQQPAPCTHPATQFPPAAPSL